MGITRQREEARPFHFIPHSNSPSSRGGRLGWRWCFLAFGREPVLLPGEVAVGGVKGRQSLVHPVPIGTGNRLPVRVNAAFVGAGALLEVLGLLQSLYK